VKRRKAGIFEDLIVRGVEKGQIYRIRSVWGLSDVSPDHGTLWRNIQEGDIFFQDRDGVRVFF